MSKRVLDVGNCGPDHYSIRELIAGNFDAEVVQTHGRDDTLSRLRESSFDLVLINRKLIFVVVVFQKVVTEPMRE